MSYRVKQDGAVLPGDHAAPADRRHLLGGVPRQLRTVDPWDARVRRGALETRYYDMHLPMYLMAAGSLAVAGVVLRQWD